MIIMIKIKLINKLYLFYTISSTRISKKQISSEWFVVKNFSDKRSFKSNCTFMSFESFEQSGFQMDIKLFRRLLISRFPPWIHIKSFDLQPSKMKPVSKELFDWGLIVRFSSSSFWLHTLDFANHSLKTWSFFIRSSFSLVDSAIKIIDLSTLSLNRTSDSITRIIGIYCILNAEHF